jgi:hypothetical protein
MLELVVSSAVIIIIILKRFFQNFLSDSLCTSSSLSNSHPFHIQFTSISSLLSFILVHLAALFD